MRSWVLVLTCGCLTQGSQDSREEGYGLHSGDTEGGAVSPLGNPLHQILLREVLGLGNPGNTNDFLGFSLEAGDFNADGVADLVIGTPFRDIQIKFLLEDAGDIWVVYGRTDLGLQSTQAIKIWHSIVGSDIRFGLSLAAGRFWGTSKTGLAVGAPHRDIGAADDAGMVQVFDAGIFADGFESGNLSRWSDAMP